MTTIPTDDIPAIADSFVIDLDAALMNVRMMLIEKNRKYGDAALNPKRMFSRAPASEQIRIRIDDKISRIASGQLDEDEDVQKDLLGYLILLQIANKREEERDAAAHIYAPLIASTEEVKVDITMIDK